MFKEKKIGVALSGGGLKGLAHIGVLRVLEEYKVPIDMISGTSMGALIGALYSSEPNAKKLEKEALSENLKDMFDYTLSKYGIIKGKKIEEYLDRKLGKISFKELKIPLFITACDIDKDVEIIFHKGIVAKAVRASISIPGIFMPVENNREILVDGGILDPVPIDVLRKSGADIIIAVNAEYIKEKKPLTNEMASVRTSGRKLPSIFDVTVRSLEVMGAKASKADIAENEADLVINIDLKGEGLFNYHRAKKYIEAGKRATRRNSKEIKSLAGENPLKGIFQEVDKGLGVGKIVGQVRKGLSKKAGRFHIVF